MRKCLFVVLLIAPLLVASLVSAQSPFYTPGPVWRVVYIHLKPGQGDAFWNDVTKNLKPIYEEQKKQGRQDSPDAALIKTRNGEVLIDGFAPDNIGDQESRQDEEDIDPQITAG